MPRRPTCNRPLTYGRCVLTAGHRGYHWDGGAESAPPPPRPYKPKAQGSVPMFGTMDDVRALKAAARVQALALARAGARLPKDVGE